MKRHLDTADHIYVRSAMDDGEKGHFWNKSKLGPGNQVKRVVVDICLEIYASYSNDLHI